MAIREGARMTGRVSVQDAADRLGITQEGVRVAIRSANLPPSCDTVNTGSAKSRLPIIRRRVKQKSGGVTAAGKR